MTGSTDKQTILIIDDDKDLREIMTLKLNQTGFVATTAANGKEGLDQLKTAQPDLVLLDMSMPEMDGAETLWHIRHDLGLTKLPVIFLTNYGEVRPDLRSLDAKYAQEAGANGYIRKTDDLTAILKQIRSTLAAQNVTA